MSEPTPQSGLPHHADVVIVGAGLAGLVAAAHLQALGAEVLVLEADDAVGGRVRTDLVDGALLDRGFQLLNPAYPAVRRLLDLKALQLRSFVPGLIVRTDSGAHRFADPLRKPSWALAGLLAPLGSPLAKARFAAYVLRAVRSSPERLREQDDSSAREALLAAGVGEQLFEGVLRPFLAGVFLEPDLTTSRRYLDLVLRSFMRGTPAVPAHGMQAIPRQVAERLAAGTVHLAVEVVGVLPGAVTTTAGEVTARAIVVATDPRTAARLLPGLADPAMRDVTTWYHRPDAAGHRLTGGEPVLVVDGERRGPVVSTVVMTHAAPEYDPGRTLVSSSTLSLTTGSTAHAEVLTHLSRLYGVPTSGWELIAPVPVAGALPAATAPHQVRRLVSLGEGLFVTGDHRDTPSIQGAMASGTRVAVAVAASIGLTSG